MSCARPGTILFRPPEQCQMAIRPAAGLQYAAKSRSVEEAMRGLADKRVLITGGAQGIGAATAARFIDEGARVIVLDKNAAALAEVRRTHPKLDAVLMADVSEAESVAEAFGRLDRLWEGLDVLVNNAGISIRHAFTDIRPEDWRRVLTTNLD